MHYADLSVTSTWTQIPAATTPTIIQNIGNSDIRVSKGAEAPTNVNMGNVLFTGMSIPVAANQTLWVRTRSIGRSIVAISDVE